MTHDHPAPAYRITVDGKDISNRIRPRLISLTLTDNRGFEADTVELTLDDSDGQLALPRRGAKMRIWLGWQGQSLVDKGSYTIDELEHSGAPDQLSILGKAADLRGSLNQQREQSYHGITLGDIINTLAGRHGLEPCCHPDWAAELLDHLDQQNESDASFLTRLARNYDAIATIKHGKLLFIPAGTGRSAGGTALPPVTITRQSGDGHRFAVADRNAYTGVIAYWQDNGKAKKEAVELKQGDKPSNEVLTGSSDNVKTLRHVYASKRNAQRAARAEWERLQRGVAEFTLTLARGRPELFPERPVTVRGFKPQIDQARWILTQVVHSLDDSGYTNRLQLEVKADQVPEVEA